MPRKVIAAPRNAAEAVAVAVSVVLCCGAVAALAEGNGVDLIPASAGILTMASESRGSLSTGVDGPVETGNASRTLSGVRSTRSTRSVGESTQGTPGAAQPTDPFVNPFTTDLPRSATELLGPLTVSRSTDDEVSRGTSTGASPSSSASTLGPEPGPSGPIEAATPSSEPATGSPTATEPPPTTDPGPTHTPPTDPPPTTDPPIEPPPTEVPPSDVPPTGDPSSPSDPSDSTTEPPPPAPSPEPVVLPSPVMTPEAVGQRAE